MKTDDKVVNLFCIYTILSIIISGLAWAAVGLGLVLIPDVYTSTISPAGWAIACLAYLSGLFMVHRLTKYGKVSIGAFALYPAFQALALTHAYVSHGWLYAPSAGSQGTIPALAISLAMLVYLFYKTYRLPKFA